MHTKNLSAMRAGRLKQCVFSLILQKQAKNGQTEKSKFFDNLF